MQEYITSRENGKVKQYLKLASSTAFRAETGLFVAQTYKLIADLLSFGIEARQLFYTEDMHQKYPQLQAFGGKHYLINDSVSQKLSEQKSASGIYLIAKKPIYQTTFMQQGKRYICMENMQDPTNVGTMLRTAVALGYYGAVLAKNSADPFSQKALRASMGAAVKIPLMVAENMETAIMQFQKAKITTVAATMKNAQNIDEVKMNNGVAIFIGNEGNGLTETVVEMADIRLKIPMAVNTESLNAAAAATIFMWQFRGDSNE